VRLARLEKIEKSLIGNKSRPEEKKTPARGAGVRVLP